MRRTAALTSVAVLVLMTAAITWGMAASASARGRVAASPPAGRSPASAVTATKAAKKVKVKPGSTWTLTEGARCETDTFAAGGLFSAGTDGTGDSGTWVTKSKKVTMTWKAGSATGDVFVGTFAKVADKYSGTYTHNAQGVPATLIPTRTAGCDVVTTAAEQPSIEFGDTDNDVAAVIGGGGFTPTGTIHFYACPGNANPCTSDAGEVTDLGTVAVAGSGSTASAISLPFTPETPGIFCFLGVYSGDSHYPPASDGSTADECFAVFPGGG
jgi:hypothetical protein